MLEFLQLNIPYLSKILNTELRLTRQEALLFDIPSYVTFLQGKSFLTDRTHIRQSKSLQTMGIAVRKYR